MTASTDLHDDDLRRLAAQHEQEAAAALAEVQRREQARADAEADRQRERDTRLVLAHAKIETDLLESARLAETAFSEAAARGDYTEAFRAYVALQAIRPARQMVRDRARAAEATARTGVPVSEQLLPWYPSTFLERLQQAADDQAAVLGEQTADRLCTQASDGAVQP